jgi:hypothetical protein
MLQYKLLVNTTGAFLGGYMHTKDWTDPAGTTRPQLPCMHVIEPSFYSLYSKL